jgi:hypothetical protein
MATAAAPADGRAISFGRVFSRAFGTLGSNPAATFGIAFLFGAVPGLLIAYVTQRYNMDILQAFGMLGTIALVIITVVASIVFATITQGALVRATVAYSQGGKAGIGESIAAGLVVALPLIGLAILSALGIGLGMVLLIVPGVMLWVMWSVAAPALVEERLGPIQALGRSRYLTSGARWKVFGLLLVLIVCYWIFSAIVGVIAISAFGGVERFAAMNQQGMSMGYLAFMAVVQTLISAIWGVILTSLYVELREWKDGPAGENLAEVFR